MMIIMMSVDLFGGDSNNGEYKPRSKHTQISPWKLSEIYGKSQIKDQNQMNYIERWANLSTLTFAGCIIIIINKIREVEKNDILFPAP